MLIGTTTHLLGTLGVFLMLSVSGLIVFAPLFAFAFWRSQFGGSPRNYVYAWIATSMGVAAILALMGLAEQLARS